MLEMFFHVFPSWKHGTGASGLCRLGGYHGAMSTLQSLSFSRAYGRSVIFSSGTLSIQTLDVFPCHAFGPRPGPQTRRRATSRALRDETLSQSSIMPFY